MNKFHNKNKTKVQKIYPQLVKIFKAKIPWQSLSYLQIFSKHNSNRNNNNSSKNVNRIFYVCSKRYLTQKFLK